MDKTEAEFNLESLQNNDSFQWNQNTVKFIFSHATWDPKFLLLNGLVEFVATYCYLLIQKRNANNKIHSCIYPQEFSQNANIYSCTHT